MEPFKHSMSRDFRIDPQAVDNVLDDEEEVNSDEGDDECNPPSAKRLKKN